MGKKIALLLGCLLLGAQAAWADFGATVGLYSDYDFRGVSLSSGDPALQASVDYTKGLFYASVWGSNLDYGDDYDGDLEIDLIAGLTGETEKGFTWDVGGVYYTYPTSDSSANKSKIEAYPELYVGAGYKIFDAKLWYSWDSSSTGDEAYYVEGNLNFSLPWELGLGLHAGHSFGDYWDNLEGENGNMGGSYSDFSVGLSRSFGHFDFELKGVATDTPSGFGVDHGPFQNDTRAILSVATTFPWSKKEE